MNPGMSILGYVRVSTAEQAEAGYGLAAQEEAIKAESARRGWTLVGVVRDEGESGASLDRPGIQLVLSRIAAGEVEGLVVSKLDRLSRSVIDFAQLLHWFSNDAEATLVALDLGVDTGTASGRLIASVLASVASWEREVIAQRTKAGLAAARRSGRCIGRPAVSDDVKLAERIKRMRRRKMTMQAIADRLNTEGVPTLRGGSEWRPSSVQRLLSGPRRQPSPKLTQLPPVRRRKSTQIPGD